MRLTRSAAINVSRLRASARSGRERPAGPPRHLDDSDRAAEDLARVLRVLTTQQLPVVGKPGTGSLDGRVSVGTRPPQLLPVVGVGVRKQADPRIPGNVR